MEILHVSRHSDQGERLMVALEDAQADGISAAEIIFSLGTSDYHRSLSWL